MNIFSVGDEFMFIEIREMSCLKNCINVTVTGECTREIDICNLYCVLLCIRRIGKIVELPGIRPCSIIFAKWVSPVSTSGSLTSESSLREWLQWHHLKYLLYCCAHFKKKWLVVAHVPSITSYSFLSYTILHSRTFKQFSPVVINVFWFTNR